MSRSVPSIGLAPGVLVVGLLTGCVWRTPKEEPPAEPTRVEATAADVEVEGEVVPDPEAADLPEGITRTITRKPDGTEHVDIEVDMTRYDAAEAPTVELLPRPFTAEELQRGLAVGTRLAFHIVDQEAGQGTVHWDITEATDQSVTIAYRLAEGGDIPPPPEGDTYPWSALEQHASYPAEFSSRTQGKVSTRLGTFDAWIYEVNPPQEGGPPLLERLYFVPSLPGPPVVHEIRSEGQVVHRMELVEDSRVSTP